MLDLGCGAGDIASLLVKQRCARIIGVDSDDELIAAARALQLPSSEFHVGDVLTFQRDAQEPLDGIWCSFTAAYASSEFPQIVRKWVSQLRLGGWVCVVEVDGMLRHEPVEPLMACHRQMLDTFGRML